MCYANLLEQFIGILFSSSFDVTIIDADSVQRFEVSYTSVVVAVQPPENSLLSLEDRNRTFKFGYPVRFH